MITVRHWNKFLERHPDQEGDSQVVRFIPEMVDVMADVHLEIHRWGYEWNEDSAWRILERGQRGDCQAAVVTTRKLLSEQGIPLSASHPVLCEIPKYVFKTKGNLIHAFLLVELEDEEMNVPVTKRFVLDVICPWVIPFEKLTNYRIIMKHITGKWWERC